MQTKVGDYIDKVIEQSRKEIDEEGAVAGDQVIGIRVAI